MNNLHRELGVSLYCVGTLCDGVPYGVDILLQVWQRARLDLLTSVFGLVSL